MHSDTPTAQDTPDNHACVKEHGDGVFRPTVHIENIFSYHAPKGDQAQRYERLRAAAREYAHLICELTPPSPEQSHAIRLLQNTMMMANAAIAVNE